TDSDFFTDVLMAAEQPPLPSEGVAEPEAVFQMIGELLAQAGGAAPGTEDDGVGPVTASESGDALHHKFRAGLPLGTARTKLDAFRRECDGELMRDDDKGYEFLLAVPVSF